MALTTAKNRKSAGAIGQVWLPPGATPDSGRDKPWRRSSAWGYAGIETLTPIIDRPAAKDTYTWAVPADIYTWKVRKDKLTWTVPTDTLEA